MRYFLKAFAALSLVAVLAAAPAAPVWADARADFMAARAADKAGNWDESIRLYTKVIQSGNVAGGNLAAAYSNRGNAYDNKGQYDRAFADFNRAIELKPEYANAYYNRGNTYKHKRQYDKAIADFTRAIELQPDFAFAYYNRGRVYEISGRRALAIQDFRTGQRLAPNDPDYAKALRRLGAAP